MIHIIISKNNFLYIIKFLYLQMDILPMNRQLKLENG